jgi:hypothetical protein
MLPTMTLEILQVPGCPGADLLAARLDGVLAGRGRVTRRVVTSEADAERLGMTGSPTLLADGADPFARPGSGLPRVRTSSAISRSITRCGRSGLPARARRDAAAQ